MFKKNAEYTQVPMGMFFFFSEMKTRAMKWSLAWGERGTIISICKKNTLPWHE